jgi:hypothetical protein
VFDLDELPKLRARVRAQVASDRRLLDDVLAVVRPLASGVRTIKPRTATSVAVMAADGGNNVIAFNPFYLQVIRVVDSKGRELCFDVVSPSTDTAELSARQFDADGSPLTALGRLMHALGVHGLNELSTNIPLADKSPSWVLVYRDLCEWATLFDLVVNTHFASDTLIVRDGLLRSKIFAKDLFVQMYRIMREHLEGVRREHRRNVWVVGIAKKTQVLEYYRLGLSLARVLETGGPCYVPVPMPMQKQVYKWEEYIRSPDDTGGGEDPKYNAGSMHFVRFGSRTGDPVWTVDVMHHQAAEAQQIFGYLLADAVDGFPVPFYPLSLQQADTHSRVADLDLDMIEDSLVDAIRDAVGSDLAPVIDGLRLSSDVAARRYG